MKELKNDLKKDFKKYLTVSMQVYLFVLVIVLILKVVGLNYFGLDLKNEVIIKIDAFLGKYNLLNLWYLFTFIQEYLDERYNRLKNVPKYVGEIAGMYKDNILLISMLGHITCAKFGTVYDSFDCRDRVAEYCWVIK